MKDHQYRKEEFENEMDSVRLENKNLKMELAKSREELKESREMKQLENEELEILKIKHKSALETLAKKDDIEKEYLCSKSISEKVINTLKEENKHFEVEIKKD